MSKYDEIKSCFHCRHGGWTLERKLFCAKLQKEVGPIDDNYLSADCPLRDWPSVKTTWVADQVMEHLKPGKYTLEEDYKTSVLMWSAIVHEILIKAGVEIEDKP